MIKITPVDVIIPSFNGKYLLEKHLPEIVKNTDNLNKIIIIDNGSEDDTVDWLAANYPTAIVIRNKTNLGVTIPFNQGVAASNSDYFVLLNNDVSPKKNYLKDVFNYFRDDKVFAVSFNENASSWPCVFWKDGKLQFTQGEDKSVSRFTAWASGGSAIFKRSVWNKIGGVNEIYAPFYWEDIDIGYRAWKCGYKIIWNKSSDVLHEHESTTKTLNQKYVSLIKQRNELLFTWLNIKDKDLLASHLKFLFIHSLKHLGYLKVIFSALIRLTSNNQKTKFIKTDREVLSLINQKYEQS